MKVVFVGAGPGDPDLLTCKADRLLRACRFCIYAGSLISPEVLARLPANAERYDSASLSLREIVALFARAQAQGVDVVRLHTGDPSIYGAIREQMRALEALDIPYEVVPGVSSFQAAAAALRVELTVPEISQTIVLTRVGGRTSVPKAQELDRLAQTHATLCLFLSVHKLQQIAAELAPHYGSDCPAAVVYRASWPDERIFLGTLADIHQRVASVGIERTAMVIVGHALEYDAPSSKLYDATFAHGHRAAEPT